MNFFTIGVYNSDEKVFFKKLLDNKIDTFCDIRQRRGVRGSKYAFVNSNRLQEKLLSLNIKYGYVPELAPTSEIRELQKAVDSQKRELKRDRQELGKVFVIEYKNKVLNQFNFDYFFEVLDNAGAKNIVLFCVEEHPEACHRSLVTNKLFATYKYNIIHL
ncbi:DUF488 domain-containing protein [Pedobacter sp. MR2016-19]|uniref:DUF488 domain-containing protein n=1 Tax=Pedobacter sp. MR2016-19 TaxID=2780089 RepID=UPI0018735D0D|nr:DUF488 domain-containing protein [Pedobacter sp. MR2016-19]MBE5321207.1 DUF488 domain-containing protein [Pedobacter sp. MR2016-19]